VRYENLNQLACASGINYQTVYARFRAGLTGRALIAPTTFRPRSHCTSEATP
jgi:hypothetical protein